MLKSFSLHERHVEFVINYAAGSCLTVWLSFAFFFFAKVICIYLVQYTWRVVMRYANTNFNTSKFVFDIFVAHNGLLFPKLDDWYKWSICTVSFDIPMLYSWSNIHRSVYRLAFRITLKYPLASEVSQNIKRIIWTEIQNYQTIKRHHMNWNTELASFHSLMHSTKIVQN